MDIIRYSNILAILSPFFYGIILFVFKMFLININKKVLNLSLIFAAFISFFIFFIDFYFISFKGFSFSFDFSFFKFSINKGNILYLIFASFLFLSYSIYLKSYFKKFKHFIFTKQRFLNLFSLLVFNLFLFIISDNILTSLIFVFLESAIIYLSACFDLIKDISNIYIQRFLKLLSFSNFALFICFLISYKIGSLIDYDIVNLKFENLKIILQVINEFNYVIYLKIFIITLSFIFFIRLFVFPFASFASFLSNSSNMLYLSVISFSGCVFSSFLFLKIIPSLLNIVNYDLVIYLISFITIITSLFFVLFEKDIKIIFGYLFSVLNVLFMSFLIFFKSGAVLFLYFVFSFLMLGVLAFLFYKDKTSFSKRLINKKRGFLLESFYLLIFEKLPFGFSKILNFFDEGILDNIFIFVVKFCNLLINKIYIKLQKLNFIKILILIFLIFSLIILFSYLITYFGGNCV